VEPNPTIILLGCYHEIQRAEPVMQYEGDQQSLKQLITELIERYNIQFVGEETKQGQQSMAEEISQSSGD
jgi:hypothetical protein